jgi:6-phosphogluconolactonase
MPLDACIEEYEKSLLALLDGRAPDIVILGMGDDGHIASLFPNDKTAIFEESRSVLHTTTDTFAIHDRITVTLPILKNAEHRIFLLIGEKKRATLNAMKKEKLNIERWPAHALCDGKTTWILG